ncbi:hypothetical protein IFO70_34675 [Phormidium tenue FACHB-886]|nr:hypothetical protein [Phormidium tenue FACHB-886]
MHAIADALQHSLSGQGGRSAESATVKREAVGIEGLNFGKTAWLQPANKRNLDYV